MKKLSVICVVLLLSACGGGSKIDFGGGGSNPPPPPAPSPLIDGFIARVMEVVATAPDDAESFDVMAIAVTDPETNEPIDL